MNRRAVKLLAIAAAAALSFTGCGDDDEQTVATTAPDDTTDTTAELSADLVEDGFITACSDTPYPPFEMEGDDGEQTGFDIEIMRAIAELYGLELAVVDLPFDGILGALAAGQCDVVTSAVTINPERQEQVDFSDVYFTDTGQSILVRAEDAAKYATLDSLAGQVIGAQVATTGLDYANENTPDGATVQTFEDSDALFLALQSKQIEAVLQDLPVNLYRAAQDDLFVVTERFETGEEYGFPVEKGDTEMLDLINDGLDELRDNGTYDDIYAEFFGTE